MKNYKSINPRRRRARHYRRNLDTLASIGDFGKQVGLGLEEPLITAIEKLNCVPNVVVPSSTANRAVYIGGAIIVGFGLFLHHVVKKKYKNTAIRMVSVGTNMICHQGVADLIHKSEQNF